MHLLIIIIILLIADCFENRDGVLFIFVCFYIQPKFLSQCLEFSWHSVVVIVQNSLLDWGKLEFSVLFFENETYLFF